MKGRQTKAQESDVTQLELPLDLESEKKPKREPATKKRKGSKGFVPVTRDPEVAQSYSDNVALDYAVARGLAQALQALPPEELAALRAKVLKAAQQKARTHSASSSG